MRTRVLRNLTGTRAEQQVHHRNGHSDEAVCADGWPEINRKLGGDETDKPAVVEEDWETSGPDDFTFDADDFDELNG